jgi:ABC-type nitrate/sulfonate/bicarbonate transport system substrate-binding protein
LAALGADGVLLPIPRVYTQHFGLLTTRATLDAQQADLLKLLQALLRAERFIAEQPLKAQQVLMARLGLGQALAEAHLREHDFRVRMDQSLSNTMDSQARWAVREGHVPAKSKPEDLMSVAEPALLRKLAPNAVTIVR